ncbi:sialin-like [Oratosquilla oratoria]|uniref:sialin-like n=1 Tax=Oratosquilla oratoria TaxID=337810 RepID=UPI003F76C4C6
MSLSGGTVLMDICDPHDFRRGSSGSRGNDDLIFAVSKSSDLLCVNKVSPPKEFWGARHTLALMGFFGFASVYSMRVNLSVAIVAMVKAGNNTKNESSNVCPAPEGDDEEASDEVSRSSCSQPFSSNESSHNKKGPCLCGGTSNLTQLQQHTAFHEYNKGTRPDIVIEGEFEWDEKVQGLMLGAFFYGYVLTNVLGGRAAEYFGGKKVFGLGIVLTGLFTVVSPVCAWVGPELFFVSRFAQGLTERDFLFRVVCTARFKPKLPIKHQSRLMHKHLTDCGDIVLLSLTVLLLLYYPKHILFSITKTLPVPWRAIFTSMPFYAIFVLHFGNNWGFYTLLTEIPTYLNHIQHFDMKSVSSAATS